MAYEVVGDDIPRSLVKGNSVSWKKSLSRFPASAWNLKYYLVNSSNQIVISASADGDDHLVEINPTTSDEYIAGDYFFHEKIEKSDSSEIYLLNSGTISILTDFADATTGHDARSWVKRTLDKIRAVIDGKVQHDRANYSIHGRQLSTYSWIEILDLEKEFSSRYAAEKRARSSRSSSVKVKFV